MSRDKPGKAEEKGWFGGGLGKDDKKMLTDLKAEVVQLRKEVSELAKVVQECRKLDIQISMPNIEIVLGIVKDIRKHQTGLSEAEEAAQAARLNEVVGPLKAAVEANQP